MIDTDKYTEHTEGPWTWRGETIDGDGKVNHTICYMEHPYVDGKMNEVDAQLIADAPLLLAEVERLREALINVQRSLVWDEKDRAMDGDPITLEALVAQVEQVRSDITEMIE